MQPCIQKCDGRLKMIYRARAGQVAYGYAIGMLCAEWHIPFVPGDLNNAWTFDFPVRYQSVTGVVGSGVLAGSGEGFAQSMGEAARRLEDEGVRAITGNCGFMAAYQSYVAEQVSIPVFLSSLLQIPMLTSMLGPSRTLGVITANGAGMTPELLSAIGIDDHSRFVIQGLENSEHFNSAILQETGELDDERIREEVVQACLDLLAREPSVAAFLLECSDLPPYSKDIHAATGLPVFDWANYIRYVYGAVVPRNYSGFA